MIFRMAGMKESLIISKARLLRDYRDDQGNIRSGEGEARGPTLALRLAASIFGECPHEHFVPIRVFAQQNVQIFSGFPANHAFWLFRVTGETTSGRIVAALYPKYRDLGLPPEKRFELKAGLPGHVEEWIRPVPEIIKKTKEGGANRSPVILLDLNRRKSIPRFLRVETLSGQVPDGSHRVLAYTLLASENPDCQVRVRIVSIHPVALALVNCLTLALSFIMNPFHTFKFSKKRFADSASFELPEEAEDKSPDGR